MLDALSLLRQGRGEVVIGYGDGSEEEGRAEGNIRGTYGKSRGDSSKARNFLGIEPEALSRILSRYPVNDLETASERANRINRTGEAASNYIDSLDLPDGEEL